MKRITHAPDASQAAAEKIFKEIPKAVREVHKGQLILIYPEADPRDGPPYVFGKSIREVFKNAEERFGSQEGKLMSLADKEGFIPGYQFESGRHS